MPDLHDEQHRIEAAKHDPALFAELYEENFYRVYAYIAHKVRDRAAVEDLTSEVFKEALAGIARFEWQGVPYIAWLLRIASRAVADHYERLTRENADVCFPKPEQPEPHIERTALLFQLVERLPEAQYRVIHMRFVEQKSVREIAISLGRTEGAIKQLQFRAIENLRAQWEAAHV